MPFWVASSLAPQNDVSIDHSIDQQLNASAQSFALWRSLTFDMTANDAATALDDMDEIKKTKVIFHRKTKKPKRISIKHRADGVTILGISYRIGTQINEGLLKRVRLYSGVLCANQTEKIFSDLKAALDKKYPDKFSETGGISEYDVSNAIFETRREDESISRPKIIRVFANSDVAVAVSFRFKISKPIPYPYRGGKTVRALWKLSNSQFLRDKLECSGTGDERMLLAIDYMSRSHFEQSVKSQTDAGERELKKAADDL